MKRSCITLLIALACAGQALAADNICGSAGALVNDTTVQLDKFAEKNDLRTFDGSGTVRDVKGGGLASKFAVVVDCGNNVLVEVPTSSPRASSGLKRGDSVTFSGKLTGLKRRRYVDTHKWYLMVSLQDNSSVY